MVECSILLIENWERQKNLILNFVLKATYKCFILLLTPIVHILNNVFKKIKSILL